MVGAATAHGGTARATPQACLLEGNPGGFFLAVRLTNDTRPLAQSRGPAAVVHTGAAAPSSEPTRHCPLLGYTRTLCSVRDGTVPACMQEYARDCISQRDCNLALPRTRTSSLLSARVRVF